MEMETEQTARTRGLKPWKPGQSGNPAGRQRGSVNLTSAIKRALKETLELEKDPTAGEFVKTQPRKASDVLARSLIINAIKGNAAAIREVMARVDGPLSAVIFGEVQEVQETRIIIGAPDEHHF